LEKIERKANASHCEARKIPTILLLGKTHSRFTMIMFA
jgi:hypothetical protein